MNVRDMNSDQLSAALRYEDTEAAQEAARRLTNITAYIRRIIDLIDGQDVDPQEEDR